MIKAVRSVVHENASVDDAYTIYEDEKAAGGGAEASGTGLSDDAKV
jgi:hypothetical protein